MYSVLIDVLESSSPKALPTERRLHAAVIPSLAQFDIRRRGGLALDFEAELR